MNPCPCGYLGDATHTCRCTPTQVQRYRSRISVPLLDRIDLHVEAPAVSVADLRDRVEAARQRQQARFVGTRIPCNARMGHAQVRRSCAISRELGDLLERAMQQLSLSARGGKR